MKYLLSYIVLGQCCLEIVFGGYLILKSACWNLQIVLNILCGIAWSYWYISDNMSTMMCAWNQDLLQNGLICLVCRLFIDIMDIKATFCKYIEYCYARKRPRKQFHKGLFRSFSVFP